MWKYIKSYFNYCSLAFKEEFRPIREYKLIKWLYLLIAFVLGVIVSDVFGIPLLELIKPVFKLLPVPWLVVVALAIVIIFLLLLIDGSRRFYERVTKELNAAHKEEISEWRRHADILYRLSLVYGMALQADDIINFFHDSLPKDRLEYLNANIDSTLFHCYGALGRDNYYQHMNQVPDSAKDQIWWIRSHCEKLNTLINRHQEQAIASKAVIQKR